MSSLSSDSNMTTSVEVITPFIASELLKRNTMNRPIRPKTVDFYGQQMTRGEWELTHIGISLSDDDVLLDGQHRLLAVIQSGVPVQMNVSRGLNKSAFAYIDTGLPRTASDRLNIDPRVAGVITSAISMIDDWGKPSTKDLMAMSDLIKGKAEELVLYAGGSAKYFSAAPIKLMAVCYALKHGNQPAFEVYANLIHHDYEKLSPACLSWVKQVNKGQCSSVNKGDAMTRMYLAISGGGNQTKMMCTPTAKADAMRLIREVLSAWK